MQLFICTKKGILHLPVAVVDFELLCGKNALTVYTFGTGVAQHTFCSHCGMHAFYVPRSQPDRITVNARCLDGIDGPSLKPIRFFDGRHWEDAQHRRIAEGGQVAPAGLNGAVTLQSDIEMKSFAQLTAINACHIACRVLGETPRRLRAEAITFWDENECSRLSQTL